MFEASLSNKLKKIFAFKKATFDLPGESQEQECIFIQVEKARNTVKDARVVGEVRGKINVFANSDKLPYGYFAKKIAAADNADTKDLFFYDFEENAGTIRNISERTLSFIYFYNEQYDPEVGEMTSINLEVTE